MAELDITNEFELNRTHWALKDADLLTVLRDADVIDKQEKQKISERRNMVHKPHDIQMTKTDIQDNNIHIEIRPEIYEHVKIYLDREDYFHAVDEAYKVVRKKLQDITGKDKATDVFNANAESNKYHIDLFGENVERGTPESDFYRGIGYIHLAVQFLRNEKAHSLADDIEKNLAIHYLSLASLAYDLISRTKSDE